MIYSEDYKAESKLVKRGPKSLFDPKVDPNRLKEGAETPMNTHEFTQFVLGGGMQLSMVIDRIKRRNLSL